jgi:serine/threonine protein kinase
MLADCRRLVQILAEEIGRGGYGAVFKAWNQRTGELVAIKRLHIRHVEENASSIQVKATLRLIRVLRVLLPVSVVAAFAQTEINLLKKLHHPNIVEYKETIRTADALYIVLEYVENGSLAQTLKKFGSFSETLTAVYISQVLRGLEYLHNQGVIHRDIKVGQAFAMLSRLRRWSLWPALQGANILTTKTGVVKLADFGVAMSDSEKSNSVVGTPYWSEFECVCTQGFHTWHFAMIFLCAFRSGPRSD